MVVCQGDIFWARLSPSMGSEPAFRRPVVVVQRDSINRSKFRTVVVVPLTSNTKHALLPGNVLIQKGEANLSKSSLARCTHIMVVDRSCLIQKLGALSENKTNEILENIYWVLEGPVKAH